MPGLSRFVKSSSTGLAYPGGPTFGYTYDADGARRTLSDPGGTTTYTVDQLGRSAA